MISPKNVDVLSGGAEVNDRTVRHRWNVYSIATISLNTFKLHGRRVAAVVLDGTRIGRLPGDSVPVSPLPAVLTFNADLNELSVYLSLANALPRKSSPRTSIETASIVKRFISAAYLGVFCDAVPSPSNSNREFSSLPLLTRLFNEPLPIIRCI